MKNLTLLLLCFVFVHGNAFGQTAVQEAIKDLQTKQKETAEKIEEFKGVPEDAEFAKNFSIATFVLTSLTILTIFPLFYRQHHDYKRLQATVLALTEKLHAATNAKDTELVVGDFPENGEGEGL